jgi:hypothetical protein
MTVSIEIDVSIVATAHRPENWKTVYDSVITNLNVEFIFVGPNSPKWELPSNFKYIKSKVKPTQCVEIGLRASTGKFILIFADDLVFEAPHSIDKLKLALEAKQDEFAVAGCKYIDRGVIQPDSMLRFTHGDENSPVMPLAGLMYKSALDKIGSIDRRFVAVSYDLDLGMRFWEAGGGTFLNDVFVHELEALRGTSRLFNENWKYDREFLNSLWIINDQFSPHRLCPVEPFQDIHIIKFSQGPRGHWRGGGNIIIEGLQNWQWRFRRYRALGKEILRKFID